ncbi:MAG: hypothetical protein EHM20_00310 [Alphaproteobacteria bacterium]|nr:MAG: hypothetical protein EHM20_00310 [Alphaproteobacteria bacterium]
MSYEEEKEQAPFNMALNTLERLGTILKEIKEISCNPFFRNEQKQEVKISLVRQFFSNAVPLLSIEYVKEMTPKILSLIPLQKHIVYNNGLSSCSSESETAYSFALDNKLDVIIIELQCKLQEKGHFMPAPDMEGGWD